MFQCQQQFDSNVSSVLLKHTQVYFVPKRVFMGRNSVLRFSGYVRLVYIYVHVYQPPLKIDV